MSLTTAVIYCTTSPPLSGAMEDCPIVRVRPAAYSVVKGAVCPRHNSQRMFGSLWNVVVAHEQRGTHRDGKVKENTIQIQIQIQIQISLIQYDKRIHINEYNK